MKSQALIGTGTGGFFLADTEVGKPHADEVLVRVRAAGVCHTDYDSLSWGKPVVLGHEGAGEVVAIGENVTSVKIDDRVLLNWAISCRECFQCETGNTALCENHSPVAGIDPARGHAHADGTTRAGDLIPVERSFNLGTMSEYALVRKEAVITIPDSAGLSFEAACTLGCGVMTGYGSVVNAARVTPGTSVAIIGCGGVGLNCIQGARIAGATTIIALDLSPERLKMARQFGATHTIQPEPADRSLRAASDKVRALTTDGRGADYAFEATAVPALGAAPLAMIRHGGTAIQCSGIEQEITIDMNLFEWDKIYLNPLYGKCDPQRDFPRLFELYTSGELLLDEMVSKTYALDQLDEAFADMHAGRIAKGVLTL